MVWKHYALILPMIVFMSSTLINPVYGYEYLEGDDYAYEEYGPSPDDYEDYYPSHDQVYVQNRTERQGYDRPRKKESSQSHHSKYADRMPSKIAARGEKVIVINPRVHAWGAYNASGELIRAGVATSGANYCPDVKRACRTTPGTFRIFSLGSRSCKSSKYPLPRGGAPMPYCMFFNKSQGIHGSNQVRDANLSHGCVRVRTSDAEWLRFEFARIGTKVIVKPY